MSEYKLQVIKLHPDAKLPVRSTKLSAGYDIFSLEKVVIPARSSKSLSTGIAIRMPVIEKPFHVYGKMCSKSSLSAKYSIETGAGVIDFDYDQEIMVILHNLGDEDFLCEKGQKVSQLVIHVNILPEVEEVNEFEKIDSDRVGGFGSTGKF